MKTILKPIKTIKTNCKLSVHYRSHFLERTDMLGNTTRAAVRSPNSHLFYFLQYNPSIKTQNKILSIPTFLNDRLFPNIYVFLISQPIDRITSRLQTHFYIYLVFSQKNKTASNPTKPRFPLSNPILKQPP